MQCFSNFYLKVTSCPISPNSLDTFINNSFQRILLVPFLTGVVLFPHTLLGPFFNLAYLDNYELKCFYALKIKIFFFQISFESQVRTLMF